MIKPFWQTNSGSLGIFQAGREIDPIVLSVSNANLVEVISKNLPNGLKLDNTSKIITGVPFDLGIDQTYEFVIRASNNTGPNGTKVVQDRTFSISIESTSRPILLTPSGVLNLVSDKDSYILNNSTISFQFDATSGAIPAGQKLKFYIEEGFGELPPGLKLREDGLLYGTVRDTLEVDYKVVQGTYDKDFYDTNPYDYATEIQKATALSTVNNGKITSVNLTYGGEGYIFDPKVIVGGSVNDVIILDEGINYTYPPEVVFSNSPVSGGITAKGIAILEPVTAFVSIQTIIADGGDATTTTVEEIVDGGDANSTYSTVSDGGAANNIVEQILYYKVVGVNVTEPGTGYVTPPTITFKNQGSGSGAVAVARLRPGSDAEIVARVQNGNIVDLEIQNQGFGYTQPPLISFGLPNVGARIISRTYKFKVTVSNGVEIDTKEYTILVKSEDSLRVDTTFISSDTEEFDTSKTFVQNPIWITDRLLPNAYGNNNFIFDLEVFDPTPTVGDLFFSLMDINFDGTESTLGPENTVKNSQNFNISSISLTSPTIIKMVESDVFDDGDRIKIVDVIGTEELNNSIFYVKKINSFDYALYLDRTFINPINSSLFGFYEGNGKAKFQSSYLEIDPIGGEIHGFIPYQPLVTKNYNFTVKVSRILDGVEVASVFKQFILTVKGNIEGEIKYTTSTNLGSLKPNEVSLLKVEAESTLPSSSIIYQVVPGYGRSLEENFVELDISEINGNIYIEGYGLNPTLILEKGQSYKINVNLENFNVSFQTLSGEYYNSNLRHSSGGVGISAQEKSNGYYIFIPPYDDTQKIKVKYTNKKNDGLFLNLKRYDPNNRIWNKIEISSFFDEYNAFNYNLNDISNNRDTFAIFLNYTTFQFEIKKYNFSTLSWEKQIIPLTQPENPNENSYWLDLESSNYGLLEFRFDGLKGLWTKIKPNIVNSIPDNNQGSNGNYFLLNDSGTFKMIKKINGIWKVLRRLNFQEKTIFDPNVFFRDHYRQEPTTNILGDVWFKYSSLFNGNDKEIVATLKGPDNLPTDLSISSNGEILGKINPSTGNIYRSFYTGNVLYLINDVVTFDSKEYICTNQYRSSGNWFQDLNNWNEFFYTRRVTTTIDNTLFGAGKFSIAGPQGDDNTSIDKLLRFKIRAKDTQNVSSIDKDFTITYDADTNIALTNIYLQPFLNKESRNRYFNFITDPTVFLNDSIYRPEDTNFGIQRIPKMLLLGGIESTTADRYISAVQKNYYDRPLYFGNIKTAKAVKNGVTEYEVIYVEINDPYEVNGVSVVEKIKLDFEYDELTADYSKIRMDSNEKLISDTGLDEIYPSSITLMQKGFEKVTLEKSEGVLVTPNYEDWGIIPTLQQSGPNQGQYIDTDPVTEFIDYGLVIERTTSIEDFLSSIVPLTQDSKFRPLWMNTSQDNTGNILGYVKAAPICFLKPGESEKIMKLIQKNGFDFKSLNFTIDRIIIQNPQGEVGDKYIKFINREIL
jgi:hypothetical protein